jgi:hypothetical protein
LRSAKGFGHLAQDDQQFALLAVFEDAVEQCLRVVGVALETSAMASSWLLSGIDCESLRRFDYRP